MAKITLTDLVSSFLSKAGLNNNFQKVEDELNNNVLYRNNPGSEPNQMEQFLDMNSNRIVNVGTPVAGTDALRLKDITDDDKSGTAASTSVEDTDGKFTSENVEGVLEELSNASTINTVDSGSFYASADVEATLQEIGPHIQEVIEDVATLQAASFETGIERIWLSGYYGVGTPGGGALYRDAGDTSTADNGGTVFVDNDGVRWKRNIDSTVYVDWFGVVGDGVVEEEAVLRAAVSATPNRGILVFPDRDITILIDIPSATTDGITDRMRGVFFDKPMTVKGSRGCLIKVKDFCSAWNDFTDPMTAIQAESSDVTIDGLRVDANADNHYETDGSGNKFWETGPDSKRPPNGIGVFNRGSNPNLEHVVVKNNIVTRPLTGIAMWGNLGGNSGLALDEPSFLDGTLTTNLVDGAVVEGNVVHRARGNDYLISTGVINTDVHGNKSFNSMYHPVRFYTSAINCHAYDNYAYVDYDYLATGYNQTDLWYWRTDDNTDGQYLIRRSGYRAGASFTSVIDCSLTNNVIAYQSNSPTSSIIDTDSTDAASFQTNVSAVKNIQIKNNRSYRSPFLGLLGFASAGADDGKDTEGVVFSGNEIYECRQRTALLQGNNFSVHDNVFENCSIATITGGVIRTKGDRIRFFKNTLRYNLAGGTNSNTVFDDVSDTADGEDDLFISDNIVEGFTGTYATQSDSAVNVHGTDFGIKPSLENGWTNQAGELTLYKSCSGLVSIVGHLNGGSSTSDTVFTLPSGYSARENIHGRATAIQSTTVGSSTAGDTFPTRVAASSFIIDKLGQDASRASFTFTYQADGRLFV